MISIVVASRNDNYGGNLLHRTQVFMDSLDEQCSRYGIDAELIIVEWNPPNSENGLADVIPHPKNYSLRIIEVPSCLHKELPNSDKTPMFEYIAKNVGVRRAKGDFVLVTNPDIIFNEELASYLAKGKLLKNQFYRVDRYDVDEVIPIDIREACNPDYLCKDRTRIDCTLCCCRNNAVTLHTLGVSLKLDKKISFIARGWFAQKEYDARYRVSLLREGKLKRPYSELNELHTNASGDFLLMAKDVWLELRGFPEMLTMSHLDSYMCVMAASYGIEQVVLPSIMHIFHQNHERDNSKRPMTDLELWRKESEIMLRSKTPIIKNNKNWGLGDYDLVEKILV